MLLTSGLITDWWGFPERTAASEQLATDEFCSAIQASKSVGSIYMKELICADDFFPTIESDVKDTLCSPSEGSRDDPLMPTIRIGCSMWTKGLFAEGLRISRGIHLCM